MGGVMLIIAILGWTGAVLNVFLAAIQSQKLGSKLRSSLFKKVTYMDASNVLKFGDFTLITRTTNDVTQLRNVFQTAVAYDVDGAVPIHWGHDYVVAPECAPNHGLRFFTANLGNRGLCDC